jgi:hypothetical protein
MYDLWASELTFDEEEVLIEKAASKIAQRKLETPAILALEMHKPVAYISSQAAIVFSPFLVPFLGFDNINNYSRLFAKKENVERLITRLETKRLEPRNAKET